jgi:hypothetical protein
MAADYSIRDAVPAMVPSAMAAPGARTAIARTAIARLAAFACAAAACGRIGYDPLDLADAGDDATDALDAPGLPPIHDYRLQNSYADEYGGPPLMNAGGTLMIDGYQFTPNQGLAVAGALPDRVYTIDLIFSFDTLGNWRKILDFKGLSTDEGLYTYQDHLQYVVVAGTGFADGATTLTVDTTIQVSLTRDAAGQVVGYVDRVHQFDFPDTGDVAALPGPGDIAHFFIDDPVTSGNESSGGIVRRIRIWDVALTESQLVP